jgi:hypothetical protein
MKPFYRVPCAIGVAACAAVLASSPTVAAEGGAAAARQAIEAMKASPQGPFESIRWFCSDGTVQPARPYACKGHGGGVQHGQWTAEVVQLRSEGWRIGNVLAGVDPAPFVGKRPDLDGLDQILLERFLVQVDDGWIFRGARSYRGALQVEDEEAGARELMLALLADPDWLGAPRFARVREAARLLPLPHGDEASAARVRHLALELAEKDAPFTPLRAKIHNVPDAGDAARVRQYARSRAPAALRPSYERLAAEIDALYRAGGSADALEAAAARVASPELAAALRSAAAAVRGSSDPSVHLHALAGALEAIRDRLPGERDPALRLQLLEASARVEDDVFAAGAALSPRLPEATRRQQLAWLADSASALYGVGFLSQRLLDGTRISLQRLGRADLDVNTYREELRYLARAPEWSGRWLAFNFGDTVNRWMAIEPQSHLFTQDRLRGSPLLFYGMVIDGLSLDANRAAGIEHEIFGQRVGAGLRALNPGIVRGPLIVPPEGGQPQGGFGGDGIYLLPESTSDLPRVTGILTQGEGSSLSHVQLLARNLGIPNVVVGDELVPLVRKHAGERVVLAVSPSGVVQLGPDGPQWEAVFGPAAPQGDVVIRPDLKKLDLKVASMIPLSAMRSTDAGRIAGPKGANLAELKHFFGDEVPDGFVITFGVFRKVLDQPLEPGGPSVWDWMKQQYDAIGQLQGPAREQAAAAFLSRLRSWIVHCDPGKGFRDGLRMSLDRLGRDGTFGAFVRSDTNVEDLAGFTGAGLNLTVPNVIGFDNILQAVKDVWASPFTERAYGWRQSHMEDPEYVFPAVAVVRSFASQKSGVMVTVDVDTGDPAWLSVAINEGVGGAVEGQAAESLRVPKAGGQVRVLAQATAPTRYELSPQGGLVSVPASGSERVLQPDEIRRLMTFAASVSDRFPALRTAAGTSQPADVEFGFHDGKLGLLQIRPFVESRSAQRSTYLAQLDAPLHARGSAHVDLDAVPQGDKP